MAYNRSSRKVGVAPRVWLSVLVLAGSAVATPAAPQPTLDRSVYDRALQFMGYRRDELVLNAHIRPHWRAQLHEGFTYLRGLGDGRARFTFVDAKTGEKRDAFDAAAVSQGLSQATGISVDRDRLGFDDYEQVGPDTIRFTIGRNNYICATVRADCRPTVADTVDPARLVSPDGKWAAFLKDHNLWVQPTAGGETFALTTDGEAHCAYGVMPEGTSAVVPPSLSGKPLDPLVLWSPDSRRIFTTRVDERAVKEVGLLLSSPPDGSVRPRLVTWRQALPDDAAVPMEQPWVFDVASQTGRPVGVSPYPDLYRGSVGMNEAWWSREGNKIFLINRTRYFKSITLHEIDAASGQAHDLITENAETFLEPGPFGARPVVHVLNNGDIIWYSERDGWAHLYFYDRTGKPKRQLTRGQWLVRAIVRVDETAGLVFFLASAREPGGDPYFVKLYSLRLSNGAITLLTPENGTHEITSPLIAVASPSSRPNGTPDDKWSFSPSGRFFVDTYSSPGIPPRSVLRRANGDLIAEIERADISRLQALNLTPAERFSALAADGKTLVYGNILRPSNFDPTKSYPIVDEIYPGPQRRTVADGFMSAVFGGLDAQAMADLGFIVVSVDGRGTPGRSKAFMDYAYGNLSKASELADHVAALKSLAARYPYIDLDRVGVYGLSAGGYGAAHAILAYPEFYKAAFAAAGNHNQALQYAIWGETYNGPDAATGYEASNNATLAASLKGKLMLEQGESDYNVSPAQTMQLANALIKANKDFDLLIVPNEVHELKPYVERRLWDYMVRNLQGMEPPKDYLLPTPRARTSRDAK